LTLVSGFSHTELDPERSSARGVELLRSYLKYADSGGAELGDEGVTHPLNAFELAVKHRLEKEGLTPIPQYGASGYRIDFAVVHPDRPGELLLAVEADGASYHSSPTARDRDRLRQQVLERLGWRFHRIWSTDWFRDPDAETAKVVRAVAAALEGRSREQKVGSHVEVDDPQTPLRGKRPWFRPGLPIVEYSHAQLVSIAKWIMSDTLLRTRDELVCELMRVLGFQKRGSRIVQALGRAADEAVR
jgi:very-short-patch-repair endonuclease